jgi:hypothetical protein
MWVLYFQGRYKGITATAVVSLDLIGAFIKTHHEKKELEDFLRAELLGYGEELVWDLSKPVLQFIEHEKL